MSRVWLRMSDDFWLHLRPSVKFALVTLYRVMHTRPHLIQNFAIYIRSIFACDSRGQITRSAIRLPNHFLSPSFPLALSHTLLSLCLSRSFVFFHSLIPSLFFPSFFTKLTVISEISISSLVRGCVGAAGLHVRRRIANPDVTIALIPRYPSFPPVLVPLLSASPQGFCAPPRNVIFPPAARVLPATNLRRSNNSAPFVRLSIRTILYPSSPSLRYSSPYIGAVSLSFSIHLHQCGRTG